MDLVKKTSKLKNTYKDQMCLSLQFICGLLGVAGGVELHLWFSKIVKNILKF